MAATLSNVSFSSTRRRTASFLTSGEKYFLPLVDFACSCSVGIVGGTRWIRLHKGEKTLRPILGCKSRGVNVNELIYARANDCSLVAIRKNRTNGSCRCKRSRRGNVCILSTAFLFAHTFLFSGTHSFTEFVGFLQQFQCLIGFRIVWDGCKVIIQNPVPMLEFFAFF